MTEPRVQIRACWSAPLNGGPLVKGASEWQTDTPGARTALRKLIDEGIEQYGEESFWIDAWIVSDVLRPETGRFAYSD